MNDARAEAPPPLAGPLHVEVAPSFWLALRGVWLLTWRTRLNLRRAPNLLIGLLLMPVLIATTMPRGEMEAYGYWTITFYLMLIVPIQCLTDFGAMIRDDIQTDTLRFLITRPVPRMQLVIVKFLSFVLIAQGSALACGLLIVGAGGFRGISDLGPFALWFLMAQAFAILAYGALSALLGLISQRYMVLGIVYGFVVEMGIGRIPTNINNLSISRHLRTLLANNPVIAGQFGWEPEGTLFSIGMLLLATVVFVAAAAFLFAHREYHAHEEMQK